MIKDWEIVDNKNKNGTRKHVTKSELIVIKNTNERFIILYSIEKREKAHITQCYIFKYNYEFEKIY
jgi:hypothetical protein